MQYLNTPLIVANLYLSYLRFDKLYCFVQHYIFDFLCVILPSSATVGKLRSALLSLSAATTNQLRDFGRSLNQIYQKGWETVFKSAGLQWTVLRVGARVSAWSIFEFEGNQQLKWSGTIGFYTRKEVSSFLWDKTVQSSVQYMCTHSCPRYCPRGSSSTCLS